MDIKFFFSKLTRCSLFENFTYKQLSNLFNNIKYRVISVNKGSLIHSSDEQCSHLIIILNGSLCLEHNNLNNYKSIIFYKFNDGDIIGANTLFSPNNNYKLDIYSTSDSLLLYISKNEILNLCITNNVFLENYLSHLSLKSQYLIDKINMLSNKSLRDSIIDFIKYKYNETKTNPIYLDITKTELAKLLGVERTSLSRELKSMKNDKLIDFDKDTITILNI